MMRGRLALSLLVAAALTLPVTPVQAQFGLGNMLERAKQAKKVGDSMREIAACRRDQDRR